MDSFLRPHTRACEKNLAHIRILNSSISKGHVHLDFVILTISFTQQKIVSFQFCRDGEKAKDVNGDNFELLCSNSSAFWIFSF